MLSSFSEVNSGLFLSARLLPETKSSRNELFVYAEAMWAFTCARVSHGCLESEKRDRLVGVTALDIMRIRYKLTSCCFIRITLTENICFGRDLLRLKVDISSFLYIYIYHVFEASSRGDSRGFIYVSLKRGDRDRDGRERTLFIFFILQKHIVLLLLWLYTNKSRPFAVSNNTLFLSVRSKLMEYF